MFSVPSGRSEYLDTQLGETPILYIHISFSRLAVKIPSKLIQAQVGFFFTLPDLSFMFTKQCQLLQSNVHAPLFALTEFWFKVCSELRPLKLGFYDPLKNLQPLKKVVHFA